MKINNRAPTFFEWYSERVDLYLEGLDPEIAADYQQIRRQDMPTSVPTGARDFNRQMMNAIGYEEDFGDPYVAAFLFNLQSQIEYAAADAYGDEYFLGDTPGTDPEPVLEYLINYYPRYSEFNPRELVSMMP